MAVAPTWSKIRAEYETRVALFPCAVRMVDLIKHIETTKLSRGLYGWLSMHDLCISQTPELPPREGPHLRVSPCFDGTFAFVYADTGIGSKMWRRVVPASDAVARLEKFLLQLHWFSDL